MPKPNEANNKTRPDQGIVYSDWLVSCPSCTHSFYFNEAKSTQLSRGILSSLPGDINCDICNTWIDTNTKFEGGTK